MEGGDLSVVLLGRRGGGGGCWGCFLLGSLGLHRCQTGSDIEGGWGRFSSDLLAGVRWMMEQGVSFVLAFVRRFFWIRYGTEL